MDTRTVWFIGGMVLVALLAMYAPRLAGLFVILLVMYLGITAANKRLV